jgi:hypothetical protein
MKGYFPQSHFNRQHQQYTIHGRQSSNPPSIHNIQLIPTKPLPYTPPHSTPHPHPKPPTNTPSSTKPQSTSAPDPEDKVPPLTDWSRIKTVRPTEATAAMAGMFYS